MTIGRLTMAVLALMYLAAASGCSKNVIELTCDEPQKYQAVREGKRIEVPEDLDPLNDLREIPIPRAESTARPPGSLCIEEPPSVIINKDG